MPFDLPTFTLIHVVLSLVGIFAGLVVVGGLMSGRRFNGWIATFLVTTILTNVTSFGFSSVRILPSHYVAGLSLVILPFTLAALYWKHLAGKWRTVFVVTSVVTLYLNAFVLVTQVFSKTPALVILAPTQKEPPFAITHVLVLIIFVVLGREAVKGFREG